MLEMNLAVGVAIIAGSFASAMIALVILVSFGPRRRGDSRVQPERMVMLFSDRALVDATAAADRLLARAGRAATDFDRLAAVVSGQVGDLAAIWERAQRDGRAEALGAGDQPIQLIAEDVGGALRVEIVELSAGPDGVRVDPACLRADQAELAMLRDTVAAAPTPIWRTDAEGAVTWANQAYLAAVARHLGIAVRDVVWPPPAILRSMPSATGGQARRLAVTAKDPPAQTWYDVTTAPAGAGHMHYAMPADATVRAELSLREFVQTLTKTFAQLPVGLAIFDRQRRLTLFNPALTDLTQLGPEFLAAGPTLHMVLDRLRETRMIPEPKDYPSWRRAMTDLETRALAGLYEETWTLPSGQTFRVTGRPHPDGAVAFIMADISAETQLTRRFRAEIEIGQNVIDALEEPLAVFSEAGMLIASNTAFVQFTGADPETAFGRATVWDVARLWETRSDGRVTAADLVRLVTEPSATSPADGTVQALRHVRLPGGMSLIGYRPVAAAQASGGGPACSGPEGSGGPAEGRAIRRVRRRTRGSAEEAALA
jgi:PAS domain-containing protein